MAKLLGLIGSPRQGGNSALLASAFMEGALESGAASELIYLADLSFKPCRACDACAEDGICVVDDDMRQLYPRLLSAPGLLLAAPIFFGSLSAQTKMFIDRFQCWWHAKYRLRCPPVKKSERRPAFLICVGALKKKEYCESARAIAELFFTVINFHPAGYLCFQGFDKKGSLKEDPQALPSVKAAGKQFAARVNYLRFEDS